MYAGNPPGIFLPSRLKSRHMQELIDKLKTEAGLTEEQAIKAINSIKDFVIEKYPMLEGAVSKVFSDD